MQLFDTDAFWSLRRVLCHEQPLTWLDVGANVGDASRAITQVFPRARVYAFEPSPAVADQLETLCAGDERIRPVRCAAGAAGGVVPFHVTRNTWCASVLRPSALASTLYEGWHEVERVVSVPMARLDDWALGAGVAHVDAIKLDVQGLECAALRGAERLLQTSVTAVVCEAQLAPEYDGASTFAEIDALLAAAGFRLWRITDVASRGTPERTTSLDAVWLKAPVLDWLIQNPERAYEVGWAWRARRAAEECLRCGLTRVAIYGAGAHTRVVASVLRSLPVEVACVIDDNPATTGSTIGSWPVVDRAAALALRPAAVLLSSNCHEVRLWQASAPFRDAGIPVLRLYPETAGGVPQREQVAISAPPTRHAAEKPRSPSAAKPRMPSRRTHPEQAFRYTDYLQLNRQRLAHLAGLDLPLESRNVLEVGAGIGDLTGFFLDRGCRVTCTDGRPENVAALRERFGSDPRVQVHQLDLEHPPELHGPAFDVVFCYGVLYHLADPGTALAWLSAACGGLLLVETCVSFGAEEELRPVTEDRLQLSQAIGGVGCRPTRTWVMSRLKEHFEHVYVPRTQPAGAEFPVDWSRRAEPAGLSRAVFVASRSPLTQPTLSIDLLMQQGAA